MSRHSYLYFPSLEDAISRIPKTGIQDMNINDYIAMLTEVSYIPIISPDVRVNMERTIGVYAFLRDRHSAQTVKDALLAILDREVSSDVISLWVSEGMTTNISIYNAIKSGYPELAADLERTRNERSAKIWR